MSSNKIVFFALSFAFLNFVDAQTFTWTGSSADPSLDNNWDEQTNWSTGDGSDGDDGYPNSTSHTVIIANVTDNPVINISGAICGALTIESSGLLTSNNGSNSLTATSINLQSGGQLAITNGEVTSGNFTHAGVLTVTGGTLDINGDYTSSSNVTANINGGTIEIAGDWDGTSGSGFDPSGGTVFFNGSAQSISTHASNYFHNLTFGGATNTKTAGSDLVVNGNLLISSGTLDMAADANTLDVGGNFTLSGVGFIPYAGVHDIAGDWDDSGSGNAGFAPAAGKIILSGSSSTITTKSDNNFFNLEIDKSSATATCNSDITIGGILDFEDGTLDIAANTLYPEGNLIRNSGTISASSGGAIHYGTAGTYDICAISDDDIEIKLLNSASGAINLTTAGNIDCKKIWLNKSTHIFLVDGETVNISDEINIQSGKFQITSGIININSNDYNDIHLQSSTSTLDIDGGTINVGNNSNSSSGIEMAEGTLDLSSGTLNIDHNIKIDAGTVTQSGGTISVKHYVGDFDGPKRKFLMSSGTLNLTAGTLRLNGQNANGGNAATYPAIDVAGGVTVNANANHVILVQSNNSSSNDEDMYLDFNGNTIGDLTINLDGHTVFHQTDVNLLGDLTLTAGTIDLGSTDINVSGNWDDSGNNGGFTPSSGTVTLSGSGTTITTGSNNNFFNLTSVGDKTVQSELDINGDLTVSSGEFALGANDVDVASSKTVDCDGTISLSTGVFTANGPSDFTNGTLSISSTGTYDANGTFTAASGNITFTGAGFLKCNNTVSNLGTLTITSGTVVYDGASTQAIVTDYYYNLTIDQSGTKQASGYLDISGDLTVSNGAVFDINGQNASVGGNWNDAGGTFQATGGGVLLTGGNANITTGGSNYFSALTIWSTGTKTAQSSLDINGNFTFNSGTFDINGQNADVAGNWNDANGTFQAGGGTVTLSGGNSDITTGGSNYFSALTVDATGTKTAQSTLDINGNFTLTAGTFAPGSNVVEVAGNWSNSGTFTPSTGTVTFNGIGAQTISGTNTFYDLTINNAHASSKVSANGSTLTVQDDLLVSDGIFESASDYVDVTISGGATLELTGNITVSGDWSNSGTFTPNTNTVTFDGGVAQSLTAGGSSFYNLSTATASTNLTIQDALVVSNDLTIAGSTTLDAGSDRAISVGGDWDNSGTFTSASNTVTFNGSGAQTITTGGTGTGNDFNNVTVTNTGTLADGSDVETSGAIKVNGTLDVTDGQFMPAVSSDFVNVTLSSSNGKLKQAGVGTITVSGTWNNSGGSSASFDSNFGTVSFDGGGAQSLTSGGISFRNLSTATTGTDLTIQDALIVSNNLTIAANTTLDAGSNQDISVGRDWSNSGTFTSASGTVTFNGSFNQTITTGGVGTGNDFYNLTIANTGSPADPLDVETSGAIKVTATLDVTDGQFMPATSSEFLDVTVSASGGILKPASSSSITVSGNWSDASGTFTPNSGTVTMDGTSKTIATGASNEFNNLTISGSVTTSTANDVEVEGTLTVSGSLTVSPGDELTLEDATISGTLTVDADGSNDATLDFSEADNPVFGITGTLRLDGEDASNRAIVKGDGDSRIDFDITGSGVLNADYFTFQYPNIDGLNITGSGTQVLSYGAFDYPANSGTLLNISAATDLPDELTGFSFGNTGSASSPKNVTADGTTDLVTFTSYSGALASDASTAETNETDASNKVYWFNNLWYSSGNQTPTDNTKWWSTNGGSGLNPSDFTNASHKFIVQSGDTYTATGNWTVAGEVEVDGALVTGGNTITMAGKTDIDGTLTISNGGVYDANGEFDATGGTIDQDGTSALRMSGTVTSLGSSLDNAAGTVEYDGGAQDVFADDYYNLVIDQSGNKTAQGAVNVANDMTISNSATFLTSNQTIDISGATTVSATLDIGNGQYNSRGGFSATGNINFSHNGGKLNFFTVSPTSLGTLDNSQGTVDYESGATNVLSDDYPGLRIIGGGAAKTLQGDVNVADDLIISSGNELNLGNNTITVAAFSDIDGVLDFDNGGIFDANAAFDATNGTVQFTGSGGTLKLGGATVTSIGNTFDPGSGTVEYDYSGNQQVKTRIYYNLNMKGSGTKETPNSGGTATVTVENDLDISSGVTFDVATGNDNIVIQGDFSNSGTLTATDQSITFSGASSAGETSALINDASVDLIVDKTHLNGGVTFQGASSFDNVTISDGYLDIGAYTFTADELITISAAGTLRIPNSGTFNADGQLTTTGTIDFTGSGTQGDLICSNTSLNTFGTMDGAAGTVTFDGSSSQALDDVTFFNLTNSNTSGLTIDGSSKTVTVNGVLNLSVAADITTGANTLTIGTGGSITNAAGDRHINVDNTSGFLAKSTNSTAAFSFPVGNGTVLRPIRLTPSSASATTFSVRYDDNRYSDGSVTANFSNNSGHISGYDGDDPANNAASSGYYYDISRSGSANAVLYIEWTDENQYGTGGNVLNPNITGITFGYYNGSDWDVITSSPSGSISNGNVTSNAFNFAGQYVTLGSLDGENNLPIDLVSFEGECIDNQTNLEFVVASQVNNEYFTIERSKNLLSWEKLGDIVGGGTNNEEITYSFKDISPNSGDNYYRLSQTDMNGTTESFSPIAVTCESKVENYHIYPNPTNNRIAVEFELEFYQGDDIEFVIRDFKGSIVKSNSIDLNRGYNYFEVDLSEIPNGIYMISYSGTKNHIPLKRVIKL